MENSNKPSLELSLYSLKYLIFIFLCLLIGIFLNKYGLEVEGASIAILGFAPIIYVMDRRLFSGFLIGPLLFTYIFHAFGFAIGPLWQLHIIKHFELVYSSFVLAQWGCVIGLFTLVITFPLFFNIGKKIFRPRETNLQNVQPSENWSGYSVILFIATILTLSLGFLSGVANRLAGGIISLPIASLVSAFSNVSFVAFFFISYSAARYKRGFLIFWVLTYIIFVAFHFLDGNRGAPLYAGIFSAAGFVWAGFPIRKLVLPSLLVALIFIPITGIVELYRSEFADIPSRVSFESRIEGFRRAFNEFSAKDVNSLPNSTEAFSRAITARTVDRVFLLTPQYIPFAGFEGLNKILFSFVPEIINPERPILLDGNELAIRYGAAHPKTKGSYIPTVGDGYRRGGWIGIILLYIFTSMIYAISSAICWEKRGQREWMAMFIFILYQSPGMWSATLLSNFYLLLWLIPRNFIVFWFLRIIQDFTGFMTTSSGVKKSSINQASQVKKFLDESI